MFSKKVLPFMVALFVILQFPLPTIVNAAYPDYIMDQNKMVFGDFEGASTDGWVAGANAQASKSVTTNWITSDFAPGSAEHGTYFLETQRTAAAVETMSYSTKTFSQALDLSSYSSLYFNLYGWDCGATSYIAELVVYSGNISKAYDLTVVQGGWRSLQYDISDFSGIQSVSAISIGYRGVTSSYADGSANWNGGFSIDYIYASPNVSKMKISNFEDNTTDGWTSGSGTANPAKVVTTNVYSGGSTPIGASQGIYFLEAQKDSAHGVLAQTPSYVVKNFSPALDLSKNKFLNFDLYGWGGVTGATSYTVELIVTTQSGSMTYDQTIAQNGWRNLTYDLSNYSYGINQITSIAIGYCATNSTSNPAWNGAFSIDNIYAYSNNISILSTFEDNTIDGWAAGSGVTAANIKVVTKDTSNNPANPAEGTYFLETARNAISAGTSAKIVKTFSTALDLSNKKMLRFDFDGYGGVTGASSYIVEVIVTSSSGSMTYDYNVNQAIWRNISCDLSNFPYAINQITSISIGYAAANYTGSSNWAGDFSIDNVRVINNNNPVIGVSLNKNSSTLIVDGTDTLASTIAPQNAANQAVTWSSSDANIATVDSNGLVTAINPGIAAITATTQDGSNTATCDVTVNPKLIFSSHIVSGNIITNIQPDSTTSDFLVGTTVKGASLAFSNLSTCSTIMTGTKIDVMVGGVSANTYTSVIYGDVNEDGVMNLSDLVLIRDYILGSQKLNTASQQAGNFYDESDITLNDLVGMMAYVSGTGNIIQDH